MSPNLWRYVTQAAPAASQNNKKGEIKGEDGRRGVGEIEVGNLHN